MDGEPWEYEKFVHFEVIDEGLEFLFDSERYFREFKHFGETKSHPNEFTPYHIMHRDSVDRPVNLVP